jgi:hypothetical protein
MNARKRYDVETVLPLESQDGGDSSGGGEDEMSEA